MTKIYVIWRYDFDRMENREPVTRRILGYVCNQIERDLALTIAQRSVETYPGKEGGWGGVDTLYPKFEAEEVNHFTEKKEV